MSQILYLLVLKFTNKILRITFVVRSAVQSESKSSLDLYNYVFLIIVSNSAMSKINVKSVLISNPVINFKSDEKVMVRIKIINKFVIRIYVNLFPITYRSHTKWMGRHVERAGISPSSRYELIVRQTDRKTRAAKVAPWLTFIGSVK